MSQHCWKLHGILHHKHHHGECEEKKLLPPPPLPTPGTPIITVFPSSLGFVTTVGTNPEPQIFTITNTGGGQLAFSVENDAKFLTVTPTSGIAPANITVSVDVTGLAPGGYNAGLIVRSTNFPELPPVVVTVQVIVEAITTPIITVTPEMLEFKATECGANPCDQKLTITNSGIGDLFWLVTSDVPWLHVTPTSGSGTSTVIVSVCIAGLAAGCYTGNLLVTGNAEAVTIPVLLTIQPKEFILKRHHHHRKCLLKL